jgi:tripartite ATP-independent transporter DctP family solute receptor
VKGGLAGIIASGMAPTFARAEVKKLVMAHIVPAPESGAVGFAWQAEEVRKRSGGELDMQFFGGTLLSKELEIMNAVKSGNIQMGDPAGAAATVFPEMGVFLVPYLVQSYAHAYKMFNGAIGDQLDKQFQDKYKLKVMCFFDYGFRHFWTSKKAIVEPKDLRGAKIRVQQAKVFGDTINGLGGNAVPMAWGEVISAAKSGVIDGGDLPIVNQIALKIYEVSKYCSMTFHNYGPTNVVIHGCLRGDVDLNDTITCADVAAVRAALGAHRGDANYVPRADMDDNGVIDQMDVKLARFYGFTATPNVFCL